jgi:hypothetical protein
MKGQVIADFIVDHLVNSTLVACLIEIEPWTLFFNGSVCSKGHEIACLKISPNGIEFKLSVRLEFACMNNQCEYEALLCGLEYLQDMGLGVSMLFGTQVSNTADKGRKSMSRWGFKCLS